MRPGDPRRRQQAEHLMVVDRWFDDVVRSLQESRVRLRSSIVDAADLLTATFEAGGKVLVCGNGGSAADAQHLAAEFVGRFKLLGRRALPAIALTADTAVVTAWSNDTGYEDVFARQVEALGRPGDLLIAISTSGRSPNVLRALATARGGALRSVALLRGDGGAALPLADVGIVVPSGDTQHVQEVHGVVMHLLCELVEQGLAVRGTPVDASQTIRIWAGSEWAAAKAA